MKGQLTELAGLRSLQEQAGKTLGAGLQAAQEARSALSTAISERTELPRRFTEDPEVLRGLLESADTLEAFAAGLTLDGTGSRSFEEAKGKLELPVLGSLLLGPGETDAKGVTRPGLVLATRAGALVTSPWAATIRYRGPLLNYGNVMILEPGGGYLLVLAGLNQVYGEVGEVVALGAPLGLMGGTEAGSADFASLANDTGARETETRYVELRPVSYTHLDVYKGQAGWWRWIWARLIWRSRMGLLRKTRSFWNFAPSCGPRGAWRI